MSCYSGLLWLKRELSWNVKLSIYWSIFVPTLSYGHEIEVTKRMRLQIQGAEMGFLWRVAGLSLRDRMRSLGIQGELGVGPLLFRIEKTQLRWFGHCLKCFLVVSLWRFSWHILLGGGLGADPELVGGIIYPLWPGNASSSATTSWSVVGNRDVWVSLG